MRFEWAIAAICMACASTPAWACQTLTPEGVARYQDAEVEGLVKVTGPTSALLTPTHLRTGVHRKSYEISWHAREKDGLPVFRELCNEWAPTEPEVRGVFHLQRKAPGGPYIVLAAETDEPR